MADLTTTDNTNTEGKKTISELLQGILGGDKPLVTTNNKVEIDPTSAVKSAVGVFGVWFLFMLLLLLAKSKVK